MRTFASKNIGLMWAFTKTALRVHPDLKPNQSRLNFTSHLRFQSNHSILGTPIQPFFSLQPLLLTLTRIAKQQSQYCVHTLRTKLPYWSSTVAGISFGAGIVKPSAGGHEEEESHNKGRGQPVEQGYFSDLFTSRPASYTKGPSGAPQFIRDVARTAQPSVVSVEVKGKHRRTGKTVPQANGSGFIVKSDESHSLIITTAHVVNKKKDVIIKLNDGTSMKGHVLVVDQVKDLAVVLVQPGRQLPSIQMAPASGIRVGEFVAAMGSPMSLHNTVTQGIVSSSLRASKELGIKDEMKFIQTDAVIGEGNSGGPLVNMAGQAIGVNSILVTDGISFAIPTDYARTLIKTAQDVVAKEQERIGATRPIFQNDGETVEKQRYIGIHMHSLNQQNIMELKEKYAEFPNIDTGVMVHTVIVSSPAYFGNMHSGDVIVEINDEPIQTAADVYRLVESSDKLKVKVIRGHNYLNLKVATEEI